jgi:hypothetical protein
VIHEIRAIFFRKLAASNILHNELVAIISTFLHFQTWYEPHVRPLNILSNEWMTFLAKNFNALEFDRYLSPTAY